jgi:hypothetical protein
VLTSAFLRPARMRRVLVFEIANGNPRALDVPDAGLACRRRVRTSASTVPAFRTWYRGSGRTPPRSRSRAVLGLRVTVRALATWLHGLDAEVVSAITGFVGGL